MDVQTATTILLQAREAERQGDYTTADQLCESVLDSCADASATSEATMLRGVIATRRSDFPRALELLGSARDQFALLSDELGVAKSVASIGTVLRNLGDYQGAHEHFAAALKTSADLHDQTLELRMLANIGILHAQQNTYPLAIEMFQRALTQASLMGEKSVQATVVGNLGNVYSAVSDYTQALRCYHEALDLHEQLGMLPDVARVSMNIGGVYLDLGDLHMALEYLKRALAVFEDLGIRNAGAEVRVAIGSTYHQMGDLESSLRYLREAFAEYESLGIAPSAAHVRRNIGLLLREMGLYDEALEHLTSSLEVLIAHDRKTDVVANYRSLGILYADTGFAGHDLVVSEEFLLKAIELGQPLGDKKSLYESHQAIAEVYRSLGRTNEYIAHFSMYHTLENEVQKGEAQRTAYLLDRQREVEKHEQHMRELSYQHQISVKDKELAETKAEVFRLEKIELAEKKRLLEVAYDRIRAAFRETTMLKIDRRARIFVMSITVMLFLLSDSVIDPLISAAGMMISSSPYVVYALKILAVVLLKPLEDLYALYLSRKQRAKIEQEVDELKLMAE